MRFLRTEEDGSGHFAYNFAYNKNIKQKLMRKQKGKQMKKLISIFLTMALLLSLGTASFAAQSQESSEWDVSKSKSATNLDEKFESQVTLSLPSAEETLTSDVVFVLDYSSCGESVAQDALTKLKELVGQVNNTNAQVNIGVVVYRGTATERQFELQPLTSESIEALTTFLMEEPKIKGSNMHAGLLAAQAMLESSSTSDNRKYMILISDGITYSWDQSGEQYAAAYIADGNPRCASNSAWEVWYKSLDWVPSEGWDAYLDSRKTMIENTLADRTAPYDRDNIQNCIGMDEHEKYANCVDVALYKCREVYHQLASKYHCYALLSGTDGQYGASFMNYLAGGKAIDFTEIQRDILYLLSAGSTVVDYIGSGTDNLGNDYNMDFVNDISRLTLKVNGEELEKTRISENVYGFGATGDNEYRFTLEYFPNGTDSNPGEHFVWYINESVSNFAPVQLTYSVKLTNPQTGAGTYGQYDEYGNESYSALYTNNSATLNPIDSNLVQGQAQEFNKPTVSYTVESTSEDSGSSGSTIIAGTPTPAPIPLDPPTTGDEGGFGLYLAAVAGAALLMLALVSRKKEG